MLMNQAIFEKNFIYLAIPPGFLCFLVCAIQCEANKSNLWLKERPIGLRTIKILRDLHWLTRCVA